MLTAAVLVTVLATLCLVVAEWKGSVVGRWVSKPAASLGFVLTAAVAGGLSSPWGRFVVVALVLCCIGDVLLIPHSRVAFFAGLVSFLLGHVVFAFAFGRRGVDFMWLGSSLAGLVPFAIAVWHWLSPRLRGPLRIGVGMYVGAIIIMAAVAAGTVGARGDWRILAGALAFVISDLTVARDRFVYREPLNRVVGLPLYYGAQILLALSVA